VRAPVPGHPDGVPARAAGPARGAFVTVEGVEGAGKTTQVALLAERLRGSGREVLVVREPGGTPLAEEARRLALDPALDLGAPAELFLMLVARADLVHHVVGPALALGTTVLADRFDLSTRAYQIGGRGLPEPDVTAANRLATGGVAPDLVVVLDVAPEVGRARQAAAGKRRDRLELAGDAFHARVAEAFRAAAGPGILHLPADAPPSAVHAALWGELARRFPLTFSPDAG
jgi:dTMP kinase